MICVLRLGYVVQLDLEPAVPAPRNHGYVSQQEIFVSDPTSYPALREWRRLISDPRTLVAMAGVAGILAIVGPVDTGDTLRPVPRLIYWIVTVFATYSTGLLAAEVIQSRLPKHMHPHLRSGLFGCLMGLAITAVVFVINGIVFGDWLTLSEAPQVLLTIFVVATIISILFEVVQRPTPQDSPQIAPLLARLPIDKRGSIIALSVQDHYVQVITTKGKEMVLMRLSDAMGEAGAGFQVHRSHWIAPDHVTDVQRENERAILTMTSGDQIPVSRAYIPALREAGLLPRGANG